MKNSDLKKQLLKEASERLPPDQRSYDYLFTKRERVIAEGLLEEASHRIDKLRKNSSIKREAMAAQDNMLDLRNANANVTWTAPNPSERINDIENQLGQAFGGIIGHSIRGSTYYPLPPERITIEDAQKQYPNEPDATLRMAFQYQRHIMPQNNERFMARAQKATEMLDAILPKYGQFSFSEFLRQLEGGTDVGHGGMPLQAFHHTTIESAKKGGLGNKQSIRELQELFKSEQQRYSNTPITLPDGQQVQSSHFYGDHINQMNAGYSVQAYKQPRVWLKVKNEDIDTIRGGDLPLIKAIEDKVRKGYWFPGLRYEGEAPGVNPNDALYNATIKMRDRWLQFFGYDINSQDPGVRRIIAAYDKKFTDVYNEMKRWMQIGCFDVGEPLHESLGEMPEEHGSWQYSDQGFGPKGEGRARGLPQDHLNPAGDPSKRGRTKHSYCPVLSRDQLVMILTNLTEHDLSRANPWFTRAKDDKRTGRKAGEWAREGQWIGSDEFLVEEKPRVAANGWDTSDAENEPEMPVVPSLTRYDGKIVYDTDQVNLGYTHLAKNSKALTFMLKEGWGKWCDDSLRALQNFQQPTEAVAKLWQSSDDEQFHVPLDAWSNIIGGLGTDGKVYGNRTNAETFLEAILNQYKTYEEFVDFTESGSLKKGQARTAYDAPLPRDAFEMLQKYGYQMSKMMDFANGVMVRSCEEERNNRVVRGEPVTEYYHGRGYSTSSSQTNQAFEVMPDEKGLVVIGVKAVWDVTDDPQGQQAVNEQRLALGGGAEPAGIVNARENMRYWIGEASPSSLGFKPILENIPTWERTVDRLFTLFPSIRDEFGAIIEPVNSDLARFRNASQNSFASVVRRLFGQKNVDIGATYTDEEGHTTSLDPDVTSVDLSGEEREEYLNESDPVQQEAPPVVNEPGYTQEIHDFTPEFENLGTPGTPETPETPEKQMPMVGASIPDQPTYIGRRDTKKRSLVKKTPNPTTGKLQHSSVVENLTKIANRLDEFGETTIATKLDLLLEKLTDKEVEC